METLRPVTIITGASAGIGRALAQVFAAHGHELMLVARRDQELAAVADAVAVKGGHRPIVLALDLLREDAVAKITEALAANGLEPEYVVNNAGFGLVGRAVELARAEQLGMIDLNIRALTSLSLAFVDALSQRRGGILNVASVASFLPGPGMAVYYASKAYVLSFSESLFAELKPRGVRVTALCPGPVLTEFQARAGIGGETMPSLLTLSAEQVATDGYRALMAGRRLVVPGFFNKLVTVVTRFAPRGIVLAAIGSHNLRRKR